MIKEVKYYSKVREYRLNSGLRQADLAHEIDVSRRTIITAENDNCNLSLSTAKRLAAYFNTALDELFETVEEK